MRTQILAAIGLATGLSQVAYAGTTQSPAERSAIFRVLRNNIREAGAKSPKRGIDAMLKAIDRMEARTRGVAELKVTTGNRSPKSMIIIADGTKAAESLMFEPGPRMAGWQLKMTRTWRGSAVTTDRWRFYEIGYNGSVSKRSSLTVTRGGAYLGSFQGKDEAF